MKNNSSRYGFSADISLLDHRDNAFLIIDFKEKVTCKQWMALYKDQLLTDLTSHGVIYLRNFDMAKEDLVASVESILPENSLVNSYQGGVTGRPKVDRNLFLTTVIPSENAIQLHHEMSYLSNFPAKIFFYSNLPSEHGGATPITFSRRVKKDMDPKLFNEFKKRGVCYIRNYYGQVKDSWKILLSWQKAFEVQSKSEFEIAAKKLGFEYEWIGENLRTWNVRPATTIHPVTGEEFLFTHAAILHSYCADGISNPFKRSGTSAITKEESDIIDKMPMMEQPYLAAWGDTREILSNEIIENLFSTYNRNKISLNWKKGDLMMIDNILAAHGRDPYIGDRETFALLANK